MKLHVATAAGTAGWQVIRLARALGEHSAGWDHLAGKTPLNHPMLDSRFVDAMLRHFGDGGEHLCLLGDPAAPAAACILVRARAGVWRSFLPSQAQVGPQLLRDPADLKGLYRRLPGGVARIDLLCIDALVTPLSGLTPPVPQQQPQALTMSVCLAGRFDDYWNARPKKLRDNLRRYGRRAEALSNGTRLEVHSAAADMAAAVSRYALLESKGWKARQASALTPGNVQEAFYTELLSRFAAAGQAHVYELWFGDTLAASRLMLENASVLVALKTTYDEQLQRYAPGRLLMYQMIEHAFAHAQGKRIEFCTDADQDMLAWATDRRDITHWTLFRNQATALWHHGSRLLAGALVPARLPAAGPAAQVDIHDSADALPQDVVQLFVDQERDDVQFGLRWLRNLERTVFAGQVDLRYFVLRHNGTPVAVLPTVTATRGAGRQVQALGNYYTALYAPAIQPWLRAQALEPLIEAVRQHHVPLRSIDLAPMDPETRSFRLMAEALEKQGFGTFRYFCFANWHLPHPPAWEDYLASRDGKVRTTVRRMTRRLAVAGGRVEIITAAADLERGLAAYQHVYARSWKTPEPHPGFMPGLMQLCVDQGWLRLGLVWLGQVPIAAQLWIVINGRAQIYKLAYDDAYQQHSPGTVLMATLMQRVLQIDKVREVDFLAGDDAYKKDWMSHRRERWGLVAYNSRTLSGLLGLLRETLARASKPWRRRPGTLPFSDLAPHQTGHNATRNPDVVGNSREP